MTAFTLADVLGDQGAASAAECLGLMALCIDVAAIDNGIRACDMALSVGPVIMPSECLHGGLDRAAATRRYLAAVRAFVAEVRTVREMSVGGNA